MTTPPAPLDVVYVRADGTTAVATRWSRAPKIRGLVDTRWLWDEAEAWFVLVARPRRQKDHPLTEVVRIRATESIGFEQDGEVVVLPQLTYSA